MKKLEESSLEGVGVVQIRRRVDVKLSRASLMRSMLFSLISVLRRL